MKSKGGKPVKGRERVYIPKGIRTTSKTANSNYPIGKVKKSRVHSSRGQGKRA